MSKRKNDTPSTFGDDDDDRELFVHPTSAEDEKQPSRRTFRAQDQVDPEWVVTALADIQEFTQFHFLPLAESLTAEHLETFLRQARKS